MRRFKMKMRLLFQWPEACAIDDASDAEDADAADFAAGGDMPTVSMGELGHGQIPSKPAKYEVSRDSPHNALLEQEGLQLAEASFRDMN